MAKRQAHASRDVALQLRPVQTDGLAGTEAPPIVQSASDVPSDADLLSLVSLAARLAVSKGLLKNSGDAESVADEAINKAVAKYDRSRPLKNYFLTVFIRAVVGSSERLGDKPKTVDRELRILEMTQDFWMNLHRCKPTYEDLAEASGFSVDRVRKLIVTWGHGKIASLHEVYSGDDSRAGVPRFQPRATGRPILEFLIQRSQIRLVLGYARRLPAEKRAVIRCDLNDMSDKEIASKLGISEETVRKRRFDAHAFIRKAMGVAKPAKNRVPSVPSRVTTVSVAHSEEDSPSDPSRSEVQQ